MRRMKGIFTDIMLLWFSISNIASGQYFTYVSPYSRTLDKVDAKVGTLPGVISVNFLGAATYVIPVFTSPGSAGMQPDISIIYNSQIKDGILGIGWSIAGLSEIHRVPQNYYNDNNVVGVTLQNTDRFALDSNRLILTSSHNYGADNSEYHTELETFVKVIAHGVAGTGPSWFEVRTKDGKTLEYGNTSDSKVEAYGSSTVYMWRLNKVADASGNTMKYIYNEVNGESYISRIEYTTNTQAGLNTAYNSLKFNYYSNPRTDNNIQYVGGSQIPATKLLSSIRMEREGDTLVREYQFRYTYESTYDIGSRLNQITEYGSDGTYLNSTIIGWGSTTTAFQCSDLFNNSKKNIYYTGDFNGDGRTDFVVTEKKTGYTTSDKWKLYYASSAGNNFVYKNEGYLDPTFKGFFVKDVDGNGRDDIYWRKLETIPYQCNPHPCDESLSKANEKNAEENIISALPRPPADTCWDLCYTYNVKYLYYYDNGTTGLVRGSSSYDLEFYNAPIDLSIISADLDGDGKEDNIAITSSKNIYSIIGVTCSSYPDFNFPNDIRILDFNGNGKKDLLVIKNSTSTIYEYSSSTSQLTTIYSSSTFPTINDRLFLGDFNGDKKTDFLSWRSDNGWSLKMSTGTSLALYSAPSGLINTDPDASADNNNYFIGDFNGDQKDDILEMYLYSPASKMKIYYSRGGGNFMSETSTFPKSIIKQNYFSIVDFNGDGKKDMFYYDNSLTTNYVNISLFHKNEMRHLINCIANGFNHKTQIYFTRLNAGVYTKDNNALFPVIDYSGPYYAVSSIIQSNGIGSGTTTTNYTYEGYKIHRRGKGSLGFRKIKRTDEALAFSTTDEYSYDHDHFFRYLNKTTIARAEGQQISQTQVAYSHRDYGNNRVLPYIQQSFTYDNLTDFYRITNNVVDINGNLESQNTTLREGYTTIVYQTLANTYGIYGNYGIANKVEKSIATSTYKDEPVFTRQMNYRYDPLGRLTSEVSDSTTNYKVTKTYSQFNPFGLPQKVIVSADSVEPRETNFQYDSKSRFVNIITNPLQQNITRTYEPGTGNLKSETGIDHNTTTYQYDGFGRLFSTINPRGKVILSLLGWDQSMTGGQNSLYYNVVKPGSASPGLPDQYVYYDVLGREILSVKDGLNQQIYQTKEYNDDGTLKRTSWPYYSGETLKWTSYYYDVFGRDSTIWNNGLKTSFSYSLASTTVTNPAGQTKTTKVNPAGNVVQVTENNNNIITYSYHSNGQIKSIVSAGTTISMTYDNIGRQTSVTNPNSGTTAYYYNDLGELIKQHDANGNTTFQYNKLGQLSSVTTSEGTINYVYVPSGNGIGQIQSITGPNGVSNVYLYDSYGRMTSLTETITGDQSLVTEFKYDTWGRDSVITYPSGISITNLYNADGYLNEIKYAGSTLWKVNTVNSSGQPVNMSLGTAGLTKIIGYTTRGYVDSIRTGSSTQRFIFNNYTGNLTNRTFQKPGSTLLSESFTYDNMDRLLTSQVGQNPVISCNYLTNGNISYKTDLGTYTYDPGRKNAVTNLTGSCANALDTITYNAFNLTSGITQGSNALQIMYGPDNMRIKTILTGNQSVRTKYFSPGYEKDSTSTVVKQIHYIGSPYGLEAVLIKQGQNVTTYFAETDYLGSIIGLMNAGGTYAEQFSYDAWGRRRHPTNWTYANVPAPNLIERGYTGHEHLDKFGLINMNGRMYDPVLGRFLSVDPIVQAVDNSQSINGYSYCLNNPLKYTDPSGYTYLQTLQQTYNHEGEGFWYRGNYYAWNDDAGAFFGSSGQALSSGSYSYNASTNTYYNAYGKEVPFREVLVEYIIPAGVQIDWMTITGTRSNPYQHIGWVYYTDGTKANWDMDIDQSWNLPVSMNSAPSNVGWVADMTGKICAGVLEFAIGFLGGAEVGLLRSSFAKTAESGMRGGLNLFKWGAAQTSKPTGWKIGDYMLHLPNMGTPKLNWKANYGALRSEMKLGMPIFDSYRLTNGSLIPTGGFLNAERYVLQTRGWIYNPGMGAWMPPF